MANILEKLHKKFERPLREDCFNYLFWASEVGLGYVFWDLNHRLIEANYLLEGLLYELGTLSSPPHHPYLGILIGGFLSTTIIADGITRIIGLEFNKPNLKEGIGGIIQPTINNFYNFLKRKNSPPNPSSIQS